MRMDEVEGAKGIESRVKAGSVEFMLLAEVEKLAICCERRIRIWFVISCGWSCKEVYDWMTKVATTAENKPA